LVVAEGKDRRKKKLRREKKKEMKKIDHEILFPH